jgi:hypothetical protein
MVSDLGHPGSNWYHLLHFPILYHFLLLILLLVALIKVFSNNTIDRKLTIAFLSMIVVLFGFFSILVPTRMPAFVFPVSGLIFLLMGYGIDLVGKWINTKWQVAVNNQRAVFLVITFVAGILSLKPGLIAHHRAAQNQERNSKIKNMNFFKSLDDKMLEDRVVFNCIAYDNIELMYYKNATAYFAYPQESIIDSLEALGYKLTFFNHTVQPLPPYILDDPEAIIIENDFGKK